MPLPLLGAPAPPAGPTAATQARQHEHWHAARSRGARHRARNGTGRGGDMPAKQLRGAVGRSTPGGASSTSARVRASPEPRIAHTSPKPYWTPPPKSASPPPMPTKQQQQTKERRRTANRTIYRLRRRALARHRPTQLCTNRTQGCRRAKGAHAGHQSVGAVWQCAVLLCGSTLQRPADEACITET